MKLFKCQHCEQVLYFENRQCERCSHRLGYWPQAGSLSAVEPAGNAWHALAWPDTSYRFCSNSQFDVCNWLVAANSPEVFCAACRHNRTIPDLRLPENLARWRQVERAKHRLFYSLIRLKLPLRNRDDDPKEGLAFDFLVDTSQAGGPKVLTGHQRGAIAINLKEADDGEREKLRQALGEPYRTLLGHFRHESGHYIWDRLVRGRNRLEEFRGIFGDERQDYPQALRGHYASGPRPGWQEDHISGYAAVHPWEDFAETWAHYLHIVDTLEMAFAFGVRIRPAIEHEPSLSAALDFDPYDGGDLRRLIDAWLPLTFAVNCMNRCMGEADLYPFVLSPRVLIKMEFVHRLVHPRKDPTLPLQETADESLDAAGETCNQKAPDESVIR